MRPFFKSLGITDKISNKEGYTMKWSNVKIGDNDFCSTEHIHHLEEDLITLVSPILVKNALNFHVSDEYPYPSIWTDGHYDESSDHRWFVNDKEYRQGCDLYGEEQLIELLNNYVNGNDNLRVEAMYNDGSC